MMDWIKMFEDRFGEYAEIKALQQNKFHGAVEINFCNGEPMNYNLKMHRKYTATQPLQKEGAR